MKNNSPLKKLAQCCHNTLVGEVRSNVPLNHQRANYTYHIEKDTLLGN